MSDNTLPTVEILDAQVTVPTHVVYRQFASETVMLNLQTGKYHGVNPTGSRFLQVLERSGTVRAAASVLADEYAQPLDEMTRDVAEFCADLHRRGLIELDGDSSS
jgi:hypothetical protein